MLMGATPETLRDPNFLNRLAVMPEGATIAKTLSESMAAQRTARKDELEIAAKQGELIAREAGAFLGDPNLLNKATIDTWAQGAVQRGILSQDAYDRFQELPDDPAVLGPAMQRLQTQGMSLADQLRYQRPEGKLQEVGGVVVTVDPFTGKEIGRVNLSAEEIAARTAGASRTSLSVDAFTPASETIQVEAMKELRDTFKQLKTASVDIANLRRAAALARTSGRKYMGTGGTAFLEGAKFLKNRLGVDVDTGAIVNAETARTALFQNVLNNLRKLDAQPSQEQQRIMQEALGSLNTDPDAMARVVQVYEDVIRGRVELHNRTVDQSIQSGIKMPYSLRIDLPPALGSQKPAGNQFASEADADAAFKAGKIKRGDRVTINGVSGVWE
jgi:hypothetical protein